MSFPFWTDDEALICRQVRQETPDVKTFIFSAAAPRLFRFLPGQFMTWSFVIDGAPVERCYTIASSPARPETVAITVKRVAGGVVSPWLHDAMRPGMTVQAAGPAGDFALTPVDGAKYLFLSGGSGITPVMSMARAADDRAAAADIVFVHNARSPADIIFAAELDLLARHRPGFRFVPVCETDSMAAPWPGFRGRLSMAMLRLACPDLLERTILCCGPAGYMAAAREMLVEAGFDRTAYREESFSFTAAAAPAVEMPAAAQGFKITFARSDRTVTCAPSQMVLDAARGSGLRLPFSCAKGVCGTCKSKLVSGQVDMQHGGGIRRREIEQGLILICCARPLSDLVIER